VKEVGMENFSKFYQISSVVLGTLAGLLIAVPISINMGPGMAPVFLLLFGLVGGLMGYRRRDSRVFFYLSIVSVLVLSSIIYRAFLTSSYY